MGFAILLLGLILAVAIPRISADTNVWGWFLEILSIFRSSLVEGIWKSISTNVLLLIGAIVLLFREHIRFRWSMLGLEGHFVIVGWSSKSAALLDLLLREGGVVVVCSESLPPDLERYRQEDGVVIHVAAISLALESRDRNRNLLVRLRASHANRIYVSLEGDEAAVEAALAISDAFSHDGIVRCLVREPVLQRSLERIGLLEESGVRLFSYQQLEARHAVRTLAPLGGSIVKQTGAKPRYLLVGASSFALHLVLELAETGGDGLSVVVVDPDVESFRRDLLAQFPGIASLLDLSFEARDYRDPQLVSVVEGMGSPSGGSGCTIVSIDDADEASTFLFRLLSETREGIGTVWLRAYREGGLRSLERAGNRVAASAGVVADVRYFRADGSHWIVGGKSGADLHEDSIESWARRLNRSYQEMSGGGTDWERLPPPLRESSRSLARHLLHKASALDIGSTSPGSAPVSLESIRSLFQEHEEALSKLEHRRWCAERILAGWVYGPEKSLQRKESPFLVPWEELDEEIREIDRFMVRVSAKAFLASLDDAGGTRK